MSRLLNIIILSIIATMANDKYSFFSICFNNIKPTLYIMNEFKKCRVDDNDDISLYIVIIYTYFTIWIFVRCLN